MAKKPSKLSYCGSYSFKTAPLAKDAYAKYKEVCKGLNINSREATELAFHVLYDAMQGDFDSVKTRLGGQYVPPKQT